MSFPVHSAHVGDEVEVHYRWHPYFGQKVVVRRVEERAIGQFLHVLGPPGVVVSIAGWMIDPVVCSGMTMGTPGVALAALIELNRLVTSADKPAVFRSGLRITQRTIMRTRNTLIPASGRQLDLVFQSRTLDGLSDKDRKKAILTL
ncbi:hypothetical protein, partial [Neorhizobium huautlense]|uniref:hypothetical protein n=1 Tax=Neorhizobium huautlense TaxID=67774 RepID=UPI00130060B0